MKLEDLRANDIGTTSAWIPSLGDGVEAMTALTCLQFTNQAFYYSAQQIEQLELSTAQINQGTATQAVVGLWFMSIEAYINSILRISCIVKKISFDELKKKDFGSRIKNLFDILQLDNKPFYSGTFQKLEEFKRYRNELFHDRTNDAPMVFHKTVFSGNPLLANQVDVMQAAVIAIETYHAFRYVIPGLDLMPQIMITKDESFFYEKLDYLYNEVLYLYFKQTLLKHSLNSNVDLSIAVPILKESKIFSNVVIEVLLKATPDEKFHTVPSKEKTQIGKDLFDRIRDNSNFDTKRMFKIGNYYR
jgi:hypothetical protein